MKSKLNEQWKRGGNCKLCRRKKYCTKACKANKNRVRNNITAALLTPFVKNGGIDIKF